MELLILSILSQWQVVKDAALTSCQLRANTGRPELTWKTEWFIYVNKIFTKSENITLSLHLFNGLVHRNCLLLFFLCNQRVFRVGVYTAQSRHKYARYFELGRRLSVTQSRASLTWLESDLDLGMYFFSRHRTAQRRSTERSVQGR